MNFSPMVVRRHGQGVLRQTYPNAGVAYITRHALYGFQEGGYTWAFSLSNIGRRQSRMAILNFYAQVMPLQELSIQSNVHLDIQTLVSKMSHCKPLFKVSK